MRRGRVCGEAGLAASNGRVPVGSRPRLSSQSRWVIRPNRVNRSKAYGLAVGREERRGRQDLEVQMRCGRVAAAADETELLTPGHRVAHPDGYRPGIHVRVEHVDTVRDLHDEVVSDGLEDRRDRRRVGQGGGVGETVLGCDDGARGGREDGLSVGQVALQLRRVTYPGPVLVVELVEVDAYRWGTDRVPLTGARPRR